MSARRSTPPPTHCRTSPSASTISESTRTTARRDRSGRTSRAPRTRPGPGRTASTPVPSPDPDDPAHDGPGREGAEADPEARARTILLDQLTAQARTRRQLADKLATKGIPDDVATRLLDRFTEVGLVDDEAFARAWVSSRSVGKGLGRRALAAELRRKGVDDEEARAALAELDPDDEREAARRLVERRLRSTAGVDTATATRRLVGMLARKGHSPGVAHAVVREALAAAGAEEPDGFAEADL